MDDNKNNNSLSGPFNPNIKRNDLSSEPDKIFEVGASGNGKRGVSTVNSETRVMPELRNSGVSSNKGSKEYDYPSAKQQKKKKRLKIALWVLCSVLGIIVGVLGAILWYKYYLLSKINYIEPEQVITFVNEQGETVALDDLVEETENELIDDESIHNFLLIGIDSRSKYYNDAGTGGLADVIMIMSIDSDTGTIKLVSIARDTYVYVPGYSYPMKINAAMSIGGPDLLMATVENHMRLDIDGYAYVNFYNMAGVIDAVGGVYCNVTEAERVGLNEALQELNVVAGDPEGQWLVNQTGDIWLNGRQAVAYARVRHIDSDYKRSERQVEVLRSILNQFMSMSLTGKASTIDDVLSLISTNISGEQINEYALEFLPSLRNVEIQYMQLPLEGFFNSGMYGGEWSIRANWNMEIPYVQEFLYGETTEFDRVNEIPSSPSDSSCPSDYDYEANLK